ncbi:MAG: hypothetical protein U5K71_09200 [Gracilimonas sp.]|nr:hypothetical protein [Gracilimonas sp.]
MQLEKTVNHFLKLDDEDARKVFDLGKDVRDWKVHLAKEDLRSSGVNFENITPITIGHLIINLLITLEIQKDFIVCHRWKCYATFC